MGRHRRTRTRKQARWAAIVAGTVTALLAAPLTPPAQADPFDPHELWVNVSSDATFDWIEGAAVTLYDDAGNELDTAVTDANGDAAFLGLDPGSYYVSAVADGHVEEFYDDSPDLAGAWGLFVDEFSGDVAYMTLAAEPQVSGTLTGPGGTPLESADVTVYQYDEDFEYWDWADFASTDEDGHYAIGGLDDGVYRLGFSAGGHVEEFFDDQPDVESGDDVTVTAGGAAVVADAQLEEAKQITGVVTDAGGPLEDVSVTAQQQVEESGDVFWDDVAFASTDASGTYSLDVDPGDYRVRFESSGNHVPEWWNDALAEADADQVPVTTGDVGGIDAVMVPGGRITGTVTATTGGAPLAGIDVVARKWNAQDQTWEWVSSATTAANGTYAIENLLGGSYRVEFETFGTEYLSEFYNDAERAEDADPVAVTLGNTTAGVNAALDKAGIITGTVTGPGVTQANLDVSLWERNRFAKSGWSETFDLADVTGTTYRFTGLEPGTYRVRAAAPGLAPEFYLDDYDVAVADDRVAARNTTTTANMALATAPTISGTVTSVGGAGILSGTSVLVQRKTAGTEGRFWQDYASATTDAAGNYTTTVPPGTYRVRFGHADHVTEWHDGSTTASRSTQLAVAAGNLDVDAVLDRLGRINGAVTGPAGAVSGATVSIWRYENTFGDGSYRQLRTVTTNATGQYSVTGLTPGNYRVGFRATGLQGEFNLDQADVERAADVAVELNQTNAVNATLVAPTRQLSGTVTGTTGTGPAPLNGADVTVSRRVVRLDDVVAWRDVATVQTSASGAWSVPVVDGDYRVSFAEAGWIGEYYDDAATLQDAEVVTVAGASRPGIDAELSRGGTITGTVADAATSGPLADAEVYAFMPEGDGDAVTSVDAGGEFTLTGLAPGEWVVQYSADGYVGEFYDDQPTAATADRIPVTAGSTATADAALAKATTMSGTVTGAGGAPLGSVGVDIHRVLDGGDVDYYYEWAFTESDGTWSVDLPPGSYLVEFNAEGDYLGQWYDGAASEATATEVVVDGTAVTGIDAQLQPGGAIVGTVTGPGGAPEPDAYVSVYRASATSELDTVWEGFVEDDATYRSDPLPAGSYKVRFETFDGTRLAEYHLDKTDLPSANTVAVTTGATTTVDAQLAAYPRLISGTVTDAQGRGLDGVEVSLYRNVGGSWTWVNDVGTDADGLYDVPVTAGEYRLSFTEYDNRLREWWNDAETLATATSVVVAAGADRTGINAQLADGGVVTGTVTYPQQVTGWRSTVTLFDATTGAWAGQAAVDAHQNRYRIEDLPTGSYRAQFSRTPGFDTAEGQFWSGRTENQGPGTQTVAVTEGTTTPGVNATLVDGGILTGLVRDGQGNPLEGCKVSAYTLDGALVTRESRYTGADGTFRVRGLTTGSYRLRVFDGECGFAARYYDGAGQTSTTAANAVAVGATRATSTAVPQPLVVPTGAPVANTALPTVTGTPEVGRTLTAGTGGWNPSDGLSFDYQWLADGAPIAGAVSPTYVLQAGDAGKRISVRVTASRTNSADGVATSAETATVTSGQPPITNNGVPVISDTTPEVGQALTSTAGTWSQPNGDLTFARQWTADGVDIPGATAAGYTVQASDQGKLLRLRVTASRTGFTPGTATSAATSAVTLGTITNSAVPTITGTAALGQTLTGNTGSWVPADVSLARQWLRNGTPISGATGASYTTVVDDVGTVLTLRVTATKPGYAPLERTSNPTATVAAGTITNPGAPTIDDTSPILGQVLTANTGTWVPADVTLARQWLRNGTPINGATGASYTTVVDDVGTALSLRVTATKPGYTQLARTSGPTSAVVDPNAPAVENTVAPSITGTAAVGQVLTAHDGTWTPADATLTRQWKRNGAAIAGATGATYTLTVDDLGKAITLTVTGRKAGHSEDEATSAPTAAVGAGTITATRPKVTGKLKVGKSLTAKPGTATPGTATVKYQWLRNGTAIRGATASTYKLTRKDKGKKLSVKVTRTATGYTTLVLKSAQTGAIKG